jgi:hypothetical protein
MGRRIRNLERSSNHGGEIRSGFTDPNRTVTTRRGKKMLPAQSDGRWHVTTHDELIAGLLVERHGGRVEPWHRRDGRWIAHLDTSSLDVMLPFPQVPPGTSIADQVDLLRDATLDGPLFRLYDDRAGRYSRVCDDVETQWFEPGPNGQWVEHTAPCKCRAELGLDTDDHETVSPWSASARACDLRTTLRVILPGLPWCGTFTCSTTSGDAARRWPGVVEMLALHRPAAAAARARLMLVARSGSDSGGRATSWYEVTLTPVESYEALVTSDLAGLPALPQAAPVPPPPFVDSSDPEPSPPVDVDTVPVDAEIVDDDDPTGGDPGRVDIESASTLDVDDLAAMPEQPVTLRWFQTTCRQSGVPAGEIVTAAGDYLVSAGRDRQPRPALLVANEPAVAAAAAVTAAARHRAPTVTEIRLLTAQEGAR